MTTEKERELAMLATHVDGTADTIAEYVRQIESGEYGNRWTVENLETGDSATVTASTEDNALDAYMAANGLVESDDLYATRDDFDEPTIADDYGNESPISEYPLEIVDERGKEFAVVLTVGGPHIEVVADGLSSARLEGYWGGDRVTRYGDYLSTFLDYFIDRD